MLVVAVDPLLGALGFEGAIAMTGLRTGHCTMNGSVVRVYCPGGGAKDQLTGSGLTMVGAAEKVPVAYNKV
jgi:hypothetical protein